ncbi:hypothetical protein F8M41_005726 [Gigaspora margarita]|uniref:Uncharacterized protein n=1 Tax=Gigaspora margarita TaxID=4874 RepID=A0A8H4A6L6_GIGMA|nr:hypothetical protein F8M41_005726 [Gigaspora margarita]
MEYYELCKLDETIPSKKQNLLVPKHPFRLLVAGTSESGKTNEELWKAVQCFYEFIVMDKQAPCLDDLAGEPLGTQLKIVPSFRSSRHYGISSIYIAQRFYETHPNIRANLKYISLHRVCGTLDSKSVFLKTCMMIMNL